MNQEWFCTSKEIVQLIIVFTISIYDDLKTIFFYYFINVVLTRSFCTTHMPASALDQVVIFAGGVLRNESSDFDQAGGDSLRQH